MTTSSNLTLDRRQFLAASLVGSVATAGLAAFPVGRAAAAMGTGDHTLVVVFLRGGPDGCSVLVPVDDPGYVDPRPRIAVPAERLVPVDDLFGFHPALAPLRQLWDGGDLVAVPACGSTLDTRSHFTQQAEVELAGGDDGWLARLVRHLPERTEPDSIGTVSMGTGVPRSLSGLTDVVAVPGLDQLQAAPFPGLDEPAVERALEHLHADDHPLVAAAAGTALGALPVLREAAGGLSGAGDPGLGAAPVPGGRSLTTTFEDLATLIRAGVGVRAATIDVGGWDTHDDMGDADGGRMADRLGDLAGGLCAFADALGPALVTTTVVAVGEFGRRVAENGSGGTDHGRGGVLLAVGGALRGGRYGEWPGLGADVLVDGDVPVATDWRTVVAEIVEGPMGLGTAPDVFPGLGSDRLGITA